MSRAVVILALAAVAVVAIAAAKPVTVYHVVHVQTEVHL